MAKVDGLAGITFLFMIIPIIATALFLPLYAILMYLSLLGPTAYVALTILITIVEGYSFYCFFAMIVTNMGGPGAVVQYMRNTGKGLVCCQGCCPSEPGKFYHKTTWALFHFFFTRTFLVILSAICYYSGKKAGKALYAVFSVLSCIVLFYSLSHLVILYENVFAQCKNLFGVVKLLLLKFSVGMIVLEGLIAQFLIMSGDSPYNTNDTQRHYCALVLIEFAIVSLLYWYAYSYKITAPPVSAQQAQSSSSAITAVEGLTFTAFFCQIMSFMDVFGILTFTDSMNEPLNKV